MSKKAKEDIENWNTIQKELLELYYEKIDEKLLDLKAIIDLSSDRCRIWQGLHELLIEEFNPIYAPHSDVQYVKFINKYNNTYLIICYSDFYLFVIDCKNNKVIDKEVALNILDDSIFNKADYVTIRDISLLKRKKYINQKVRKR